MADRLPDPSRSPPWRPLFHGSREPDKDGMSELIEIIEWTDDSRDTLSYRFPDGDRAIKRGAQLIVRESQAAQFVYLGQYGDTFRPGKHSLITDNGDDAEEAERRARGELKIFQVGGSLERLRTSLPPRVRSTGHQRHSYCTAPARRLPWQRTTMT
jgi:hypothetical protein